MKIGTFFLIPTKTFQFAILYAILLIKQSNNNSNTWNWRNIFPMHYAFVFKGQRKGGYQFIIIIRAGVL